MRSVRLLSIAAAGFVAVARGPIGPVESVLHGVPYGMSSGWSDWAEAMSSEPRWTRAAERP